MVQANLDDPVSLNPFRTTKRHALSARKRLAPSASGHQSASMSSDLPDAHNPFALPDTFFVPRNEAVGNASLFQVVAAGSGGAMRQSGVTWWPRPYARQRAEVNKDFTSAKPQANLQVSIHPSKLNEA